MRRTCWNFDRNGICRLVTGCLLFVTGCQQQATPGAVTLVISGDTAGWIVPCGCTSNQSGGLARRATFIKTEQAQQPVVVADVGGVISGNSEYDRIKFEAILAGAMTMGLAAQNLGLPEAKLGAQYLRELQTRQKIPFLSSNLADSGGQLIAPSHRILSVAGRKIALAGVVSDTQPVTGITIHSPRSSLLSLIGTLKGQYDHLVILAYLPEDELRSLASALPEADAVIGGPTGQSIAPERAGVQWIASATNKGKFVITLATADRQRTWTAAVTELNDRFADDPDQVANVDAFHHRLSDLDLAADQTSFGASRQQFPPDYRIAGSDRCRDCHVQEYTAWQSSPHANAWQSLTKTGSQVDADCQQCHTTGFGLPGGFASVKRSPSLTSVGCEDCHGPAQAHVDAPTTRTPFFQQARYHCDRCHDHENSPQFEFDHYWSQIDHGGSPP